MSRTMSAGRARQLALYAAESEHHGQWDRARQWRAALECAHGMHAANVLVNAAQHVVAFDAAYAIARERGEGDQRAYLLRRRASSYAQLCELI